MRTNEQIATLCREVAARDAAADDGTDAIRVTVDAILSADPGAADADVIARAVESLRQARADWAAELQANAR